MGTADQGSYIRASPNSALLFPTLKYREYSESRSDNFEIETA